MGKWFKKGWNIIQDASRTKQPEMVDSVNVLILVSCVLQDINPSKLLNDKSCLYKYIKYIWFVNE